MKVGSIVIGAILPDEKYQAQGVRFRLNQAVLPCAWYWLREYRHMDKTTANLYNVVNAERNLLFTAVQREVNFYPMNAPHVLSSQQILLASCAYLPESEQETVRRALAMAGVAHTGRMRLEGIPYIEHAVAVAQILAGWRAPVDVLAAGLLHDVLKENYASGVTIGMIEDTFGTAVADIVHEVSRLGRLGHIYPDVESEERLDSAAYNVERIPWVASALSRSPLAVIVKIADRLHNTQSTRVHVPERQVAFAAGTMNIFVPFAERLGMRAAKRDLEDGAFSVLQPEKYRQMVDAYPLAGRRQAVAPIVQQIQQALNETGVKASVTSRMRSFYNLYLVETAQRKRLPLHLSNPISVITEDIPACYLALGIVHSLWPPQTDQIRDHIAAPKPNGYRGLHTHVRYASGEELLITIRQQQMDLVAEFGWTAQWKGVTEEYLPSFPKWRDPPPGKMYALTPDGDVVMLTEKATPIDFAYAIHPGLGHQCTGAMVNGRMASLTQPLESGDVVKIMTSSASVGPSPEWLESTKTSKARNHIRRWFKAEKPGEMSEAGWAILETKLRQLGILLTSPSAARQLERVARSEGFENRQELLLAIGVGKRKAAAIADKMQAAMKDGTTPSMQATIVSLARADMPHRLASCCNPLPPDPIVGYATRRNEVTVHRADCHIAQRLMPLLAAEWTNLDEEQHWNEFQIMALDRPGLVHDVSAVVKETGLGMNSFHADRMPDGSAQVKFGLGGMPIVQRDHLIARLRQVSSVRKVAVSVPSHPSQIIEDSVLARRLAPNPYTLRPVSGEGFYGRNNELRDLVNNLRDVQPGEAVLLWGPRRIGKTSMLLQFQQHVMSSEDYVLAFVDMQKLSGRSTTMFLRDIVKAIVKELPAFSTAQAPTLARMKRDPLGYFRGFLENVPELRNKHIVLILDEFQLLSELYDEQVTLADINRYFRSMIQHRQGLSMIFCGGGVLDTLLHQPEAAFLLELARYQEIDCLDDAAARQLIVQPAHRIQYDEAAVNDLVELTAGHPYYLQWLCGELLARADRDQRSSINTQHLHDAITDWLPYQGEHFFSHLWGNGIGFDLAEQQRHKLVLTAVTANAIDANRLVSETQIGRMLASVLDEGQVWRALQNLVKIGTLDMIDDLYRIKVTVCESWLRSNHSVAHMIREMTW
ncbi:MAG: HD domain-containing protein [Ardenticatenaceae bacterium]|nr:HD domain-containing protein [Ardenticatenaceae bacterium]MCB9446585.1 HD domain-containing protein [Ardenticatenaceae bacterium]